MSLKEQVTNDIKKAMRSGDTARRDALRVLMSAIQEVEKSERVVLDDDGVQAVLQKQAKQRRESIAEYEKAGRADLAAVERDELTIIMAYLPQMMDEREIEAVVREVMAQVGASGPQEMGKVMGPVMGRLRGKADGRLVNEVVRNLLASD